MIPSITQNNDLDSFKMSNSILKNAGNTFGKTFEEVLETKAKETAKKSDQDASDLVSQQTAGSKKKKDNNELKNELPNISQLLNNQNRPNREIQNTYNLLEQFKSKKFNEEEGSKGLRQQTLNNASNFAGQPLLQPLNDQTSQRRTKVNMLEAWERFTPVVTEDISKKSVRLDIPLLNDVQAVVLRMHPDRSITASVLGSKEMGELIKQNKDKLDKNLRHHHLSLREFNTYQGDLLFDSESGTRRGKKKAKAAKKQQVDLI